MTTRQFNESVNAEIRRMTNKAKQGEMSREDANALCKAQGFATLDEQEMYWRKRDEDLDKIEATCEYFDGEDRGDLRDDGRSDGHGESYAERQ